MSMDKKDIQEVTLFDFENDQPNGERAILVKNPEKKMIVDKNQSEAYKRKKLKEALRIKDNRGNFVIAKNDSMKGLEDSNITITDRRYLMSLILCARLDGKPLTKDGEYLTATSIAELWGLHPKVASRRLKKYIDLKILEPVASEHDKRVKNYYLSEEYFIMGKMKEKKVPFVKIFQRKLGEVIANVEAKQAELQIKNRGPVEYIDIVGLLNAVMPYFHFQTYYLVRNPDDDILLPGESVNDALARNPKCLKHLTRTEISRLLGHKQGKTKVIHKYMEHLQSAGAVMITMSKNKPRYLIHPDLMFRKDDLGQDEYTNTIRNMFGQH